MRDHRLEAALRRATPRVTTAGVVEQVSAKRSRRRARRQTVLAVTVIGGVVAASVAFALIRDGSDPGRVATPVGRVIAGSAPATPGAGAAHAPVPVVLEPDQGYVRGPLLVSGSTISLAAYDHEGATFTFPPSRIVRIDARTFREEGRTDLKAEILSIADGEGARWVVTRNPRPPNGLPDAFLKRIGADGAVVSKLLPPGSDPVGNVVAGAGGVWIPIRDGVLRYDPATLQLAARYPMRPADTRSVVLAQDVVSTDAGDLVALRSDGTVSGLCACTATGDPIVGLATTSSGGLLKLTENPTTGIANVDDARLPRGFSPRAVSSFDGRVWVEGTVNGDPAVVLVDGAKVRSTVVLDNAHDVAFAWGEPDTVLAAANGALLRIDLDN
jgi:hypothetical protein